MTRARDVANLIGSGNYSSTTFTATAGQTVFSIAHTQNFVQVFMNGLLLDLTADYTSNGSAVTLTSGAAAGDEIEVVAYNTFSVGDALNQAAADTRYVNTAGDTMTSGLTINTASSGLPSVSLQHSNSGADNFQIVAGTPGVANSGFSIRDTDASANRLIIDSSGRVTTPNQPFIICTGSSNSGAGYSNGAVINHWSNQGTPIGITRSGGRFTVPVAGKYQFNANLYSYVSAQGHYRTKLAINGSDYALAQLEVTNAAMVSSPYDTTLNFSLIINLAVNDYVELKVDGAQDFYAGSIHNNLSMFLLG